MDSREIEANFQEIRQMLTILLQLEGLEKNPQSDRDWETKEKGGF